MKISFHYFFPGIFNVFGRKKKHLFETSYHGQKHTKTLAILYCHFTLVKSISLCATYLQQIPQPIIVYSLTLNIHHRFEPKMGKAKPMILEVEHMCGSGFSKKSNGAWLGAEGRTWTLYSSFKHSRQRHIHPKGSRGIGN